MMGRGQKEFVQKFDRENFGKEKKLGRIILRQIFGK
jgi:hypothetical protein